MWTIRTDVELQTSECQIYMLLALELNYIGEY